MRCGWLARRTWKRSRICCGRSIRAREWKTFLKLYSCLQQTQKSSFSVKWLVFDTASSTVTFFWFRSDMSHPAFLNSSTKSRHLLRENTVFHTYFSSSMQFGMMKWRGAFPSFVSLFGSACRWSNTFAESKAFRMIAKWRGVPPALFAALISMNCITKYSMTVFYTLFHE